MIIYKRSIYGKDNDSFIETGSRLFSNYENAKCGITECVNEYKKDFPSSFTIEKESENIDKSNYEIIISFNAYVGKKTVKFTINKEYVY